MVEEKLVQILGTQLTTEVLRSLELRFSTRELALGVCCIAWLTAAKGETFLVIDGANDSSAASRHKKRVFFVASRQPELDREYQSVGQSLRVI